MNNLVTINYNLVSAIETELTKVNLISIIDDETLTLACKERAGLNKIITSFETERKNLKKQVDDEFKSSLKEAVDLLATFDERISTYDTERKAERLAEIRAYFDSTTDLLWELAPTDEWLKSYPAYKQPVDLWVSKINYEKSVLATMGQQATDTYAATYDLAKAIASVPKAPAEIYIHRIGIPDDVKDEVFAYLLSKGCVLNA